MTKVYPNTTTLVTSSPDGKGNAAAILTVWKKSLLFSCNGFTVFDSKGDLIFRVDNYMASNKGEIVLMDAAGKPLYTIRRKRLSFGDNWLVYDGETAANPRFAARKHVNILNTKCLAHVSNYNKANEGTGGSGGYSSPNSKNVMYEIEGSYTQRCCAVLDKSRRRVAEIKQKEAVGGVGFGVDVFRLIVQPEIDAALAMTLVILLDQMFGSSRRLST
ncbi:protein LURP-one-related 8-like [Quercus lobata]|uniref:Protein LURP-one-related 8 n=1 Tax=Quercus lobata TaxID=97700 RepID=A0A7N2M6Q2_QUELO|nr:protein LURP-one-related 8-like [Quercus lobata]